MHRAEIRRAGASALAVCVLALGLHGGPAPAAERPDGAACTAPAPAVGAVISGPVLEVIDGRTLCVADGPTPDHWLRVRLADVADPRARGALMAAAFSKDVICIADRRDGQGVVGRCVFDGSPLGDLVRSGEVRAQAASWR